MSDEDRDEAPEDHEIPSEDSDVPEGVAIFPEIPESLGVSPLLLGVLHSIVFLAGSDAEIVHPAAADEAVQQIAEYLKRLKDADLRRAQEDMTCLTAYARQQQWPRGLVQTLKSFLADMGAGLAEAEEE